MKGEWAMTQYILTQILGLMKAARDSYGVDPVVFLIIYFASMPFFYYSLFRMFRAIALERGMEITLWISVFLAATVAPYLYVLIFGRNLPGWVYVFIVLLIGQGVFALVMRLRRRSEAAGGARPSAPEGPQLPLPAPPLN
jgi:hypothetical protein